jgi:hypothetical protein
LRAALEDYALVRAALEDGLVRRGQAPLPTRRLHYFCGHPGMDPVERDSGSILALCPACQRLQQADGLRFAPAFTVNLPRRDGP